MKKKGNRNTKNIKFIIPLVLLVVLFYGILVINIASLVVDNNTRNFNLSNMIVPIFCANTAKLIKWDDEKEFRGKIDLSKSISIKPSLCSRIYVSSIFNLSKNFIINNMWEEVEASIAFKTHIKTKEQEQSLYNQLVCHANIVSAIDQDTWDLEPNRPVVNTIDLYSNYCNPL